MAINRQTFRNSFPSSRPAVFPVIHVLDHDQTARNIEVAQKQNVAGVFLINHDFGIPPFLPIIRSVRRQYPDIWMGVNFLAVTGKDAFPILAELGNEGAAIDGYWGDDACVDESRSHDDQPDALAIEKSKQQCGWPGLYFGGTAFKKQRAVKEQDYLQSARIAVNWMDVVTTSGVATGKEAGTDKVDTFRRGVGELVLALASGITPENVKNYASQLDAVLVATGINYKNDFYNIDSERLEMLMMNLE